MSPLNIDLGVVYLPTPMQDIPNQKKNGSLAFEANNNHYDDNSDIFDIRLN